MSIGGHQSARAGSVTWLTPPEIIERTGPYDLDPCTPINMPWTTAARRYTPEDDGLVQPWDGRVWLNPPYGKEVGLWLAKMAEHDHGTALIFARTETEAFHRYVWAQASALFFFEGRLHFHLPDGTRAKANAGAPSVLVSYGLEDAERLAESGLDGRFVPLACAGQIVVVIRHDPGADISWTDLVLNITDREGGEVTLDVLYRILAGHPKAQRNPNWKAKARQSVARAGLERIGPGQYRRPPC